MYLIPYLSYVVLGILTILTTSYLIPIFQIFHTQNIKLGNLKSYKKFPLFIYIGFFVSYIITFLILYLLKTLNLDFLNGYLLLCLFFFLIFHSILLLLNITFIDLISGINVKSFKLRFLTNIYFGVKLSFFQIFCNPVSILILVLLNLKYSSSFFETILGIFIYILSLVMTIHLISTLKKEKFNILIRKILEKQHIINFLTSVTTIVISIILILNILG